MENKDQRPIETLESQKSESLEERQDKNCVTRLYQSPQVFLVGNASRLMTGSYGDCWDNNGWWYC